MVNNEDQRHDNDISTYLNLTADILDINRILIANHWLVVSKQPPILLSEEAKCSYRDKAAMEIQYALEQIGYLQNDPDNKELFGSYEIYGEKRNKFDIETANEIIPKDIQNKLENSDHYSFLVYSDGHIERENFNKLSTYNSDLDNIETQILETRIWCGEDDNMYFNFNLIRDSASIEISGNEKSNGKNIILARKWLGKMKDYGFKVTKESLIVGDIYD